MLENMPEEVGHNQPHKKWKPGYVYVIDYGNGGTFKIGHTTTDPLKRFNQISRGTVIMPMKLVFSCKVETNCQYIEDLIHMYFDDYHTNGEWFELDFMNLLMVYQIMSTNGDMAVYDRWYEIVPEDYKPFLRPIRKHLPMFTYEEVEENEARLREAFKNWNFNL